MRVAVVGSGPSGLYAARSLVASDVDVGVDVFDQLPAPYGLVRYGVAPDHPKMRSVIRVLRESFDGDDDVTFFGNVVFGRDLSWRDLRDHYHATIYATGTQTDRELGVPGEDLVGCRGAKDFVDWYCGHPDTVDRSFDLNVGEVAVVGAGNVALDVARMLAKSSTEVATTDVPDRVLQALRTSTVTDIHVIARRGPAHAKFTPIELREMGVLADADVCVRRDELILDADGEARVAASRQVRKNVEMLRDWSGRSLTGKPRRVHLRFLRSPVRVLGRGAVAGLVVERNVPTGDGGVEGTGEYETVGAGLVLRAVGYRARPLPGVPFDPVTCTVPHLGGRVLDEAGTRVPGDYVVGWAKRGPSGVIGTNKADAAETVTSLLEDAPRLAQPAHPDRAHLRQVLTDRGVRFTSWPGWLRLDAYEMRLGEAQARERVRVAERETMLDVADGVLP